MVSKRKRKLKEGSSMVKERTELYATPLSSHKYNKYREEIYTTIKNRNLILFGTYSVIKKSETCTFERLIAECFLNFPKVFGFMRYPNWPDSLKFDRVLRTLREKGLIVGGAGGKYSPGEISLTKFGEKIAKETESILNNQKIILTPKKTKSSGRSIDDKLTQYLKDTPQIKKFLDNRDGFSISEPEFRNILRCTLETPERVLKQNLEYFKNLAKLYNEKQLLDFLSLCENKFIKKGDTDRITQKQMKSPEEILHLFSTKEIDNDWSFVGYKPSDTGKWTHDYHRYPAKFIPQLVERLTDEYVSGKEAHINDPFMGCGTTIVTAISRGFKASGTDINKIAYLISKVKSTPINPEYLDKKIKQFLEILESSDESINPLIPQRHIDRINYWFTEEAKNDLGKILRAIYREEDLAIRDFFLVAFSHILKNCSIWLQGSTKPTRDLKKNSTKPYDALRKHLKKMQRGNEAFYNVVPLEVRENLIGYLNINGNDARNQPVSDDSIDLIVSSSPYVTSYEYADLHQLSTIWLDLTDDLTEYKKEFIGTSYKKYENKKLRSKIAMDIVNKMSTKSKKMVKEIEAFFIDMEEVFDESFRILKHGGRCCYVIGDTKLKGVDILNAEVFAESLQYPGFKLDRIIKREIPLKILPQKRDEKTGRFANNNNADSEAYPIEYIVIGLKE